MPDDGGEKGRRAADTDSTVMPDDGGCKGSTRAADTLQVCLPRSTATTWTQRRWPSMFSRRLTVALLLLAVVAPFAAAKGSCSVHSCGSDNQVCPHARVQRGMSRTARAGLFGDVFDDGPLCVLPQ